jgi:hypothetical protein
MKCDWERHIIRPKHLKGVKEWAKGKTKNENNLKKTYFCKNCDKHFVTQSGLWKHNLKCEYHIKKDFNHFFFKSLSNNIYNLSN